MDGNGNTDSKEIFMTFITANDSCSLSYQEQKITVAKALQEHTITRNGELLSTLEQRAMFPMIHLSPNWLEDTDVDFLGTNDLGEDFSLQQGVYKECNSYQVNTSDVSLVTNTQKACIFLGYKSLEEEVNKYLVNTWLSWTGANLIHAFLTKEVNIHRYVFFHRIAPSDTNLFMYVLLVECRNVTRICEMHLLDFVQRMRVERWFGYLVAYKSNILATATSLTRGMLLDKEEYEEKVDI